VVLSHFRFAEVLVRREAIVVLNHGGIVVEWRNEIVRNIRGIHGARAVVCKKVQLLWKVERFMKCVVLMLMMVERVKVECRRRKVIYGGLERAGALQTAGAVGNVALRRGGHAGRQGRGAACPVVDEARVDGQVLESVTGLPRGEMKRRGIEKSVMASLGRDLEGRARQQGRCGNRLVKSESAKII